MYWVSKKDNIIFFIFCFLYCLFSIISAVYLHTILFQTKTDSFYDQFLIIYYQNIRTEVEERYR